MSRPKMFRRVSNMPGVKGFKPYGGKPSGQPPVVINIEEYESLRLCDHALINQVQAAQRMSVSRPTFTRIYESARRKIALALTEGRTLVFEGGKVVIDNEWFRCGSCGCLFNKTVKSAKHALCPLCGEPEILCVDGNKSGNSHPNKS